jgi:hypothetical protein
LKILSEFSVALARQSAECRMSACDREAKGHSIACVTHVRRQLQELVLEGPMTALQSHEFLLPHLAGVSSELLIEVLATIDQAQRRGSKLEHS